MIASGWTPITVPYEKLLKVKSDSDIAAVGELQRWCRLNCKSAFTPVITHQKATWYFEDSKEAMLFKLTWW